MRKSVETYIIDKISAETDINSSSYIQTSKRRDFLKTGTLAAFAAMLPKALLGIDSDKDQFPEDQQKYIIEARYYEKLPHRKIRCKLCPRECVIDDRERGYCGVRENRDGSYYSLVYSRPCALHADPIEKKPLFHFHPGSLAFSIATAGCNVNCKFCQNWQISQVRPEEVRAVYLTPEKTAKSALKSDCLSIAYTYSEPTIFYEYMYDTAMAARKMGIKNVVVTAGYMAKEPLIELCKCVDAIKVDLKSFSESYYKDIVNGELKPVLDSLVTIRKQNTWTEIVYLVVPTLNDSEQEFIDLCRWIRAYLGIDVPIHFTRFHPQYLLKNLPPTPLKTLELAKSIADSEGLQYAYIGNVPGHKAEHTYCPSCKKIVIERSGYYIKSNHIYNNKCKFCQTRIAGIWGN
jgi:pyruvate formate lyase activating enzyme